MSVTSFLGAITGSNNIKIDIRIHPPIIEGTNEVDTTKAVIIDHYPSWKLHKNPFFRIKSCKQQAQQVQNVQQQSSMIGTVGNPNYYTGNNDPMMNQQYNVNNNYSNSMMNTTTNNGMQNNMMMNSTGTGSGSNNYQQQPSLVDELNNTKEVLYAFDSSQDVEGVAIIRLQSPSNSIKGQEHMGIRIQFIGRIDTGIGGIATSVGTDGKPRYDFISITKELMPPGTLYQYETLLPYKFKNLEKEFDSYKGRNVAVRYILKVIMERKFLPPIKYEKDIWIQSIDTTFTTKKIEPIKMEVGIEDCLHIEFEYNKKIYHLDDTIIGKIHFLLVRIKIKYMELAVVRRETSGDGVTAAANANATAGGAGGTGGLPIVSTNTNTNTNIYTETQTLIKYEIMDGGPIKGEIIPVTLSLKGIPADLTPTYTSEINNRFSVKYFLNLVLVDDDDRRYFKQQEIILYRKILG